MDNNNLLGELVRQAKGQDRSMREYAKDSGVDVALISKIIKGTYVPKKPEIYRRLTSVSAAPRGGVTYDDLVREAQSKRSFQEGVTFGKGAATDIAILTALSLAVTSPELAGALALGQLTGMGIAALGASAINTIYEKVSETIKRSTSGKGGSGELDEQAKRFVIKAGQFSKIVDGVLFGEFAEKGISFEKVELPKINTVWSIYDKYLSIKNSTHSKLMIRYAYLPSEQQKTLYFVENLGKHQIDQLVFLDPDPSRMVLIATNCKGTYDSLARFQNKLSYRGDLAIMYVNEKDIFETSRKWIATYDGEVRKESDDWV